MSSLRKRFIRKSKEDLLKFSINNRYQRSRIMSHLDFELSSVLDLIYTYITPPDHTVNFFDQMKSLFDDLRPMVKGWVPDPRVSYCTDKQYLLSEMIPKLLKIKTLAQNGVKRGDIKDNDRSFCVDISEKLQNISEKEEYLFLDRSPSWGEGSPPGSPQSKDEGLGYK